jgi:DNA-binding transcriptional MerR regulator
MKNYSTAEAPRALKISKNTLLRWIRENRVGDVKRRDRNGWRIFNDHDIRRITDESEKK